MVALDEYAYKLFPILHLNNVSVILKLLESSVGTLILTG